MMRKEEKTAIIEQYATHAGDTGRRQALPRR